VADYFIDNLRVLDKGNDTHLPSQEIHIRMGHNGDISTDGGAERTLTDNLLLGK